MPRLRIDITRIQTQVVRFGGLYIHSYVTLPISPQTIILKHLMILKYIKMVILKEIIVYLPKNKSTIWEPQRCIHWLLIHRWLQPTDVNSCHKPSTAIDADDTATPHQRVCQKVGEKRHRQFEKKSLKMKARVQEKTSKRWDLGLCFQNT